MNLFNRSARDLHAALKNFRLQTLHLSVAEMHEAFERNVLPKLRDLTEENVSYALGALFGCDLLRNKKLTLTDFLARKKSMGEETERAFVELEGRLSFPTDAVLLTHLAIYFSKECYWRVEGENPRVMPVAVSSPSSSELFSEISSHFIGETLASMRQLMQEGDAESARHEEALTEIYADEMRLGQETYRQQIAVLRLKNLAEERASQQRRAERQAALALNKELLQRKEAEIRASGSSNTPLLEELLQKIYSLENAAQQFALYQQQKEDEIRRVVEDELIPLKEEISKLSARVESFGVLTKQLEEAIREERALRDKQYEDIKSALATQDARVARHSVRAARHSAAIEATRDMVTDHLGAQEIARRIMSPEEVSRLPVQPPAIGRNGRNAAGYVSRARSPGAPGQDGVRGGDAARVNIRLAYRPNAGDPIVQVSDATNGSKIVDLPLGNPLAQLSIVARGGDGSLGEAGADGVDGADGAHGADATKYSPGGNGTGGAPGMNGGDGGNGGDAGNGGDVTLAVAPDMMDLLMLVNFPIVTAPGVFGSGGRGGRGGKGGKGGQGGAGYSWHEDNHLRTMPGGYPGADGNDGRTGMPGRDGRPGRAGFFTIMVGQTEYRERYELVLESTQPAINTMNGIIEPGGSMEIGGLQLHNPTSTPTPALPTRISVRTNEYVEFNPNNAFIFSNSIQPGGYFSCPRELTVGVKPYSGGIVPNTRLIQPAMMGYDVRLLRVNKNYVNIDSQYTTFLIQHPVELSLVAGCCSVSAEGEATFALKISNLSSLTLGQTAGRTLRVILTAAEVTSQSETPAALQLQAKDAEESVSLSAPHVIEVNRCSGGESQYISGSITVPADSAIVSTHYMLRASLLLDSPSVPRQLREIQNVNFLLQQAMPCIIEPNTLFLLVTNANSKIELIRSWMNFAVLLGGKAALWNASLYDGFSYFRPRSTGVCVADEMQNKVVVVLDNHSKRNNGEPLVVSAQLSPREIFRAAAERNVGTYLVSSDVTATDLLSSVVPVEYREHPTKRELFTTARPATVYDFPVLTEANRVTLHHTSYVCCCFTPSPKNFLDDVFNLYLTWRRHRTAERVELAYHYEPVRISWHTWQTGTVELRHGLEFISSKIASRKLSDEELTGAGEISACDQFAVLKLFLFADKLRLIPIALTNAMFAHVLLQVILSDLVNEYCVFLDDGIVSKTDALTKLKILSAFTQFNFSAIYASEQGKAFLREIILKYSLIVLESVNFWDAFLCGLTQRAKLASACQQQLASLMQEMGVNGEAEKGELSRYKREYSSRDRIVAYLQPYDSVVFHHDEQNITIKPVAEMPSVESQAAEVHGVFNENTPSFFRFTSSAAREEAIDREEQRSDHLVAPAQQMLR